MPPRHEGPRLPFEASLKFKFVKNGGGVDQVEGLLLKGAYLGVFEDIRMVNPQLSQIFASELVHLNSSSVQGSRLRVS